MSLFDNIVEQALRNSQAMATLPLWSKKKFFITTSCVS